MIEYQTLVSFIAETIDLRATKVVFPGKCWKF